MRSFSSKTAIVVGSLIAFSVLGCSHKDKGSPAGAAASATASASAKPASGGFPVPRASVELVLNPAGLPPYDGPTGSVEGIVTVTGPSAPNVAVDTSRCPAAIDAYGKLFREGAALPNGSRPLADAVAVVVGYAGHYLPEREEAKAVTIGPNCAYPSRTITITYGQRIDISNQSTVLFAPVIDQDEMPAVMVAPPLEKGDPVKLYPRKAGYFTIGDHMAPFVHEDLYVFRHPLHTVTGLDGHYRIDGVPVGNLRIGVHHQGVGADAEAPVEVVAGAVQHVDLTLTYAPKQPKRVDAGKPQPYLN
jgi:hypothetical protein